MNYIQQAYKGKNDWPYYIAVIILIFIGWQLFGLIPISVIAAAHAPSQGEFFSAMANNFLGLGIDKNLYLFAIILTFVFGLLFLFLGVKYIHKRSLTTLITSREKVDWKRFFHAFVVWSLIAGLATIIGILASPEDYVWNFKLIPFITLVLVSFLFLPFQTSFEELLFRGYLLQGLGTATKNRWFPLLFTSAFFGLMHAANPEVQKLGMITMVFYIGTGLFYGIVTLMDEGLELSMGLHAANNIFAAFLVTTDWTVFQTDALYIDTSEPSVGAEMFIPVFVIYPLMLYYFSKKYKWNNWKEHLIGKVSKPQDFLKE